MNDQEAIAVLRELREAPANNAAAFPHAVAFRRQVAAYDLAIARLSTPADGGDARDAARYRWLRKHAGTERCSILIEPPGDDPDLAVAVWEEGLDEEVDAAMSESQGEGNEVNERLGALNDTIDRLRAGSGGE